MRNSNASIINFGFSMNQLVERREMRKRRKALIQSAGEFVTLFVMITAFILLADNAVAVRDFVFGR